MKKSTIIFCSAMLMLSGCFTGVDSTPKITNKEVKRHGVSKISAEEQLMSSVSRDPYGSWKVGKCFYVTDSKIQLALTPASVASILKPGDIITYSGTVANTSILGDTVSAISFRTPSGEIAAYRMEASPERLSQQTELEVPFAIDMALVERARAQLVGKKMWINTMQWYTAAGEPFTGKKFVAVTVSHVNPGNAEFPLMVLFTEEANAAAGEHGVYLTVGTRSSTARTFQHIFSLTDPKKRYSSITDEEWAEIAIGNIKEEMSREACRLSLGSPKNVDRYNSGGLLVERWSYENGIFLEFMDGKLKHFRR
jgi:hypothetical protein